MNLANKYETRPQASDKKRAWRGFGDGFGAKETSEYNPLGFTTEGSDENNKNTEQAPERLAFGKGACPLPRAGLEALTFTRSGAIIFSVALGEA